MDYIWTAKRDSFKNIPNYGEPFFFDGIGTRQFAITIPGMKQEGDNESNVFKIKIYHDAMLIV